ncbi:MAG: ABC-F family ATP-binding cassette domain-containing protein [bacterium]|nr:ABC-F family ATP-binding cassette domain-containing protein [bacterium]
MRKIERLEILVKKLQLVISPKTEARKTQLERERKKAGSKPKLDNDRIEVNLNTDTKKANIALSVNDFSFAYENNILFDNASTDIFCGEKVALVGLNGTGKTTLIQKILEKGNWENPILRVGPSLTIGYLSQKQDTLNPENSIEEEIRDMGQISKSQAFQMASPFLFKYQDMQKKVATLSGGEKNRLQLIKLKYMNANFLILDEPTNHLDIPSREAIEEALLEYNGTLLIVSHDRYLLDSIVDRVIEIKDRKLISHIGNFSEFWVNNVRLNMKMSGKVSNRKSQREKSKDKKQSIKKTVSFFGVSEIENKINELENEKIQLEKEVMMFFQSNDHVKGRKTNDKLSKVVHQLNKAYEKWEKLV